MSGISACSRLQVSGNTKYRTVVFFATVQYTYSTVLHGARMYTVVNTGTVQNSIQVQVLGNTLKLGVG